jgi:hypothetical protein
MSSAGRGQATALPPPTPSPPVESSNEELEEDESSENILDATMDVKFMDDAEQ